MSLPAAAFPAPPESSATCFSAQVVADTGAGAGAGEFEALVAQHVEGYRLPMGTLAHPKVTHLTDPAHRPDPAMEAAIKCERRRTLLSLLGAWVGFSGGAGVTALGYAGWIGGGDITMGIATGAAFVSVVAGTVTGNHFEKRENRARRAAKPRALTVPADVAAAYTAFAQVPARLRALDANESAVGAVEEQAGYAEALLAEAAALHAADASATHEALAVRDTLVQMAAHAQSLVVLAQRHHTMVNAAAVSTPMLLSRRPDAGVLAAAAQTITEETALVRDLLDGAPDTLT